MKKLTASTIIIIFIIAITSRFIAAIDAPHNASNNVYCGSCHGEGLLQSFWGGSGIYSTYDELCLSCHNQGSGPYSDINAPLVKTHSSANTSNKYGEWSRECRNCHDPHYQLQKNYKTSDASRLYLATGTITACVYNGGTPPTSTLTYLTITYKSGWEWNPPTNTKLVAKTSDYRRTILFPNVGKLGYNYPVTAVDTITKKITVTGNATTNLYPPTTFTVMYGQYVKNAIDLSGTSTAVKFFDQTGTNSYADGDATYNGVCEVCHTQTAHFMNNGGALDQNHANVGGAGGTNCISCHSHINGFAHGGGGGSGCGDSTSCHGTRQSHPTHVGGTGMQLSLACADCHNTSSFPQFKDGQNLANTTACNTCHSPGGTYDGVNDATIGAKANWATGVYTGNALQAGKEKWCATCHDESPSVIQSVSAPNVVGDEDGAYIYGTGWGYYKTGHGLPASENYPSKGGVVTLAGRPVECDSCHDFSTAHIDGLARTFDDGDSSTLDPSYYRQGYRLKKVAAGQGTGASTQEPLLVPWPITQPNSANNYRLCVNCHDSGPFVDSNNTNTNLKTDGVNRHEYHLEVTGFGTRYSSDWSNTACTGGNMSACNSSIICMTCHNVHGSTRLAMVRDGKLISREPGLKIWYYNPDIVDYISPPDTVPYPQDVPLTASTGTVWSAGSSGNLCSHCHGDNNLSNEFRTPYQNVQQAPTLAWTGENGYESDGVQPDSAAAGSSFIFRVKYTDKNNDAPVAMQLWLDRNNNGVYEDNVNPDLDEKIDMTGAVPTDHNYTDGKIYIATLSLPKRTGENNSTYNYRFYAENSQIATGPPTSEKTVTATNNSPSLSWTGEAYYQNTGVYPATGGNNANFTFRIKYTDSDNECPPLGSDIQVWVDENNNGVYDPGEKHNMTAADANACSSGRVYAYSTTLTKTGDGYLSYTFRASDGFAQASGDAGPLSDNIVTVLSAANTPPQLDWETGACRTEGVSPRTGAAGADFTFLVKYTDQNNSCPASGTSNIQVWIDENDNGTYETGEKYNLTEVDAGDTDCTNGKLYSTTRPLAYAGDGSFTYRFYATDGSLTAIGDPADSDSTVTIVNGARKVRPTGGSGWYSTIQSAVAADQTILVYPNADFTPATYNESVELNNTSNVTIRSVCGPDYTIVHGSGLGWAIRGYFTSSNLTVDGFSLTGDTNGIYANGCSPIAISNCKIYGNTGNGILANNGASTTISNCEIYSNGSASLGYGGGLYILQSSHTIENSIIRNNTSVQGGGLATNNNAVVTITNTTIKDNTATSIGGGIYYNTGTLNMSKSTISGNISSSGGGGIYMNTSPTVNLENCILTGNSGTEGGMLFISTGTTNITNCTMTENQATAGDGGAIYSNNRPVVVRNSIFWNNTASGTGHNLYKVGDASLNPSTITDSDVITGRPYISNCTVTLENNIAEDPFFIGDGDYHLLSISPVIDQANAAYAPSDDIDGDTRPQGAADDMGADEYTTEQEDAEAPVVTGFTVTTPSSGNVPITLFTATDNVGVTGYRITTSSIPPFAEEGSWSATAPTTYRIISDGTFNLYPWAKDAAGNVSAVFGTPRTVVVDATAPTVTSFTATTPSLSLNIPITSFTATDSIGVTGYQITTNSTPPAAGGGGWSGTAPTTYTVGSDGTYTLYPWAKDAIGNVSAIFATPRTVVVDTTLPTVSSTDPSNGATGVALNSNITINWSENVDCTTVNTANITISAGGWSLSSCSNNQAVFATSSQTGSTTYTVTVSTSVKDSNGNPMTSSYPFSYTTQAVAGIVTVCKAGPPTCNFATIQGAISDAGTTNGKIVRVTDSAIYSENINFNGKLITVESANGAANTKIQGATTTTNSPVVTFSNGETSSAVLDGFTIDNQAAGYGASRGIYILNSSPTIKNSIIEGNSMANCSEDSFACGGAGVYIKSSAPSFDNCTIRNNTATNRSGGGIYIKGAPSVVTFTSTTISSNNSSNTHAGGIYSDSALSFTNCTINSNATGSPTGSDGGGIYLTGTSASATISGGTINSNSGRYGAGIYVNGSTTATPLSISNATISSNTSGNQGGGIYLTGVTNTTTITNTTISNNTAASGGAGIFNNTVPLQITNSHIDSNTVTGGGQKGGGLYLTGAKTTTITDTTVNSNSTTGLGGGIYVGGGATLQFTGSTINSNATSGASGGGVAVDGASVLTISKANIRGNKAYQYGGGIYYASSSATASEITNCTITGNTNYSGGTLDTGGITNWSGTLNVYSSTIAGNYSSRYGGGIRVQGGTVTVKNSIIYGNTSGDTGPNISGSPTVTYSDIEGGYAGTGNINSDPLFTSFTAGDKAANNDPKTSGDFHIQSGSPCRNTGTNTGAPADDIDGNSRPQEGTTDMGSDEYVP